MRTLHTTNNIKFGLFDKESKNIHVHRHFFCIQNKNEKRKQNEASILNSGKKISKFVH